MGESGGGVAGADAAGVLCEGSVADAEEPVFDLPMSAREREHLVGVECIRFKRGDGVDDLARAAILEFAQPLDAHDLARPRPIAVEARGNGPHRYSARLDAAVALLHRPGAAHVLGIDALNALAGAAGQP